MNRSDSPKKQPKPFGVNGQRGAILPTTPAGDNSASYEQGFPPITMILKSAGGLPPKGQDMNQILYELSALGRWSSTGALNTFDSEFASEISGYPSGAMLISDDGERIFINTTEGNLSDPNSNGTGWKDILSYLGLIDANGYSGRKIGEQWITTSSTYVPTAGTKRIKVTITGGGGGGGGGSDDNTITPVRDKTDSGRVTHNDIDFTDPNAVADAATVYERVKEMISQGTPVSEVNQYIQSASDNGLISDDSRRRMKYMNNSRK